MTQPEQKSDRATKVRIVQKYLKDELKLKAAAEMLGQSPTSFAFTVADICKQMTLQYLGKRKKTL